MSRRIPQPEYPCVVPTCPAVNELPHQKCKIHKVWTDGPHPQGIDCAKCRRPIEYGELWRNLNDDGAMPVHAPCVDGKARASKRPKMPSLFDAEVTA